MIDILTDMSIYIEHPSLGPLRVEKNDLNEITGVFYPNGEEMCASLAEEYEDSFEDLTLDGEDHIDADYDFDEKTQTVNLSPPVHYPI